MAIRRSLRRWQAAIRRGTSFGAPTEAESELAELIIDAVPASRKCGWSSSGTEATMSAIRLARGFTGRDMIIKFAGNYHGHVDSLLVAAGSSAATLGVPNSPGVTAGTARDTLVLAYNDPAGLERAFAQHGPQIAGVIFEPVVGNMGCVVPTPEFLTALRGLTTKRGGAVDLRRSDDRLSRGLRRGAIAIRDHARPDDAGQDRRRRAAGRGLRRPGRDHGSHSAGGKVFQAGTLSGNPLATAAGIATLKCYVTGPPMSDSKQLRQPIGRRACRGRQRGRRSHTLTRVGSMMTLFFNAEPVADWPSASHLTCRGLPATFGS